MKFRTEAPSLVISSDGGEQINKSIEGHEQLSGRLAANPEAHALQKALASGLPIERAHELGLAKGDAEAAVENCLKDTHGEQFSSDADAEMVSYLTKVDKVDLHQVPHCDGKPMPSGFPTAPAGTIARSNSAVVDALEEVCKSGF